MKKCFVKWVMNHLVKGDAELEFYVKHEWIGDYCFDPDMLSKDKSKKEASCKCACTEAKNECTCDCACEEAKNECTCEAAGEAIKETKPKRKRKKTK